MKLFTRAKAILSQVTSRGNGRLFESFTGAWQQGVVVDSRENVLQFSAVWSCVSGIARDIAKLKPQLMANKDGINIPQTTGALVDLLKTPNNFQTRFQFVQQWVISILTTGNTYCLIVRNNRGQVERLIILDPNAVTVLVSDGGEVYYQISGDNLNGLNQKVNVTVPASEIMHDRHTPLFHPLVGLSPIYACSMSATVGNAITTSSAGFFKNKAAPGGILTAPGRISDETAARLKTDFEAKYRGENSGKIAVMGDGLKFERLTMTAVDAQLIEQLNFSVRDVARAFNYPLFKLQEGGPLPAGGSEEANLQYYADTLQPLIEAMEDVINTGLGLPSTMHVEFDIDGLGRMNTEARVRTAGESLKVASHNEARAKLNLPPVVGGDSVYTQQQYYALEDLVRLRQMEFANAETPPEPETPVEDQTADLISRIRKGILNAQ